MACVSSSLPGQVSTPELSIYAAPEGASPSTQYAVHVLVGGSWKASFVNFDRARAHGNGAGDERGKTFSWTTMEIARPARVRVRRLEGAGGTVTLRPLRYGITTTAVGDDTVEFTVSPGQKISVEFDTEIKASCYTGPPHGVPCVKDAMLVFADRRRTTSAIDDIPAAELCTVTPGSHEEIVTVSGDTGLRAGKSTLGDCGGKRVVVFPPGVYDIGYWQVPNNIEHVHLAGGAVVFGALDVIPQGRDPFYDGPTIDHVYRDDWPGESLRSSFSLTGPGIISGAKLPWHLKKDFTYTAEDDWWAHVKAVQFAVARVRLEDVTIANSPYWVLSFLNDSDARTRGTFDNFKMVGAWTYNNDGLPNPSGAESRITNAFIHAADDAFKLYNSDSTIDNCVVWQSNNGAVFQLGWFPKTVRGVRVSDVDVIHFENWYGVGLGNRALFNYADAGGAGTISDIEFTDVRVEGPILRLFGFKCSGGQVIRDVTFNRLDVPGGMGVGNLGAPGANYFLGQVTDFTFHDFRFGDDRVTSVAQAEFEFGKGAGAGFTFTTDGPRHPPQGLGRRPEPLGESPAPRASESPAFDVVVYGATPGGIAAALSAADSGRSVLLVEPTSRIGGLITNGLSHTDFRTFEGLTGAFLRFSRRVQGHYVRTYGKDSPQAQCFRGTHAEPRVNLLVLERMLAERERIRVLTRHRLGDVATSGTRPTRLSSVKLVDSKDDGITYRGHVFIDASYEGDLLAKAGVTYRVGRESRAIYDESRAPEQGDPQVQGYNFRLTLTQVEANRALPLRPKGYDRRDFAALPPLLTSGQLKSVFCDWRGGVFKAQAPVLPNGKYDINDVSHGVVRLSLPQINDAWPDGDAKTRKRIFDEHVRHNVGLLYFLQTDESVPEEFREEARRWGFCRDEFADSGHLPVQLYVREARRMVGMHVFTERDTDYAPGDARSVLRTDSIAMGDYGPNCHGTAHEGPRFGGEHTGEFYKPVAPYQIRIGTLLPRASECVNLLVPVALSASHVGFCALRLEPIWMSLGEAAGFAAHVALGDKVSVQEVDVERVQRLLHDAGAATIYVSDVLPGHPDFAAVQWWATQGGLHGLAPTPAKPGQRGEQIDGQYYEADPAHAARLDAPLGPRLRGRWMELAASLKVAGNLSTEAKTRGDFLRAAFASYRESL